MLKEWGIFRKLWARGLLSALHFYMACEVLPDSLQFTGQLGIATFSHGNGARGEQLRLIFADMWDIIDKNTHEREIIKRRSI